MYLLYLGPHLLRHHVDDLLLLSVRHLGLGDQFQVEGFTLFDVVNSFRLGCVGSRQQSIQSLIVVLPSLSSKRASVFQLSDVGTCR